MAVNETGVDKMINNKYLTTTETCQYLGISRANFYLNYHKKLEADDRSRQRNCQPLYDIESLQEFVTILDKKAAEQRSKRMKKVRAKKVRQLRLLGEKDE